MVTKIINFAKIERKWQMRWEKEKAFVVKDNVKGKKKYYVLEMYPYPSGSGLHMGHAFNYTIGDIYARMKRMQGYNVLYPMGYDSFGLPAENAAIEAKSHPKKFTEQAIKNYIKTQKSLGLSYDWNRMIKSHDPEFYKWDQWIFMKMLEKELAYRKKSPVNWCSKCKTVLANEQVVNGKCWRHEDIEVVVKQLEQWFLRITDYADELYEGINKLKEWPEQIKKLQNNWIGKSHGTEIDFEILTESRILASRGETSDFEIDGSLKANGEKWNVFTTRPDTLFGVTFLVVSVQHPDLMNLVTEKQKREVENFLKKIRSVSEEDIVKIDKEGVFTGSYALHPFTGDKIPIWTGNFVIADYGSGMVMGVPAHDQRDYEFAKKYGLEIKEVVLGESARPSNSKLGKEMNKLNDAYTGYGILVNSAGFNGLKSEEAIEHINNALEIKHKGRKAIGYRLKDWLISRQRFWGCPIPIVYCESCGIVPVKEKDLPVKLPENIKFTSEKNPLVDYAPFVNVKCPSCGKTGKRETDTMDTFVDSSWYFLRYTDSKNNKKIFDSKKVNYWMPIDTYIGGKEHATGHLIYFRFITKFLRDIGLLKLNEPAIKLFNQGMLHASDGRKMSKSYGNVIAPETISKKYGIDAARLFLVSVASPDKDINWSKEGIDGSLRFVMRVMNFVDTFRKGKIDGRKSGSLALPKQTRLSKLQESKFNRTIRDYTDDLENFRYNLAVIKLRILFDILEEGCDKKSLHDFLVMFSVICPHISEELHSKVFSNHNLISLAKWPKFDSKKINDKLEEQERQVEKVIGDVKNIMKIIKSKEKKCEKVYLYVLPNEVKNYDAKSLSGRLDGVEMIIHAVNDKNKYDPGSKSKKVKPGRPGIYVE